MRILLVTETYLPFISGVSTSSHSIAAFMHERGHRVTLVCPHPVIRNKLPTPGFAVRYAPSIPDPVYHGKPFTPFPAGLFPLWREVNPESVDIIHIQEPGSLGISALTLALTRRIQAVGALHFTPDQVTRMMPGNPEKLFTPVIRAYQRAFYNRCSGVMIPTRTFADYLRTIGVSKPLAVVSNGVDTSYYHQPDAKEKKLASSDKPAGAVEFFYLGRLDKDKNVAALVRSLPFTTASVRLLIAGSGKQQPGLRQLADELGVGDRISWFGSIDQEQIIRLYHRADAFILLALYEIQSIVTLQALACGLPVILADSGALPELVRDGENGFLVRPFDYHGIAERMNRIAGETRLRGGFGKLSRKMSLAHHKPTVLKKLEKFYSDLIGSKTA